MRYPKPERRLADYWYGLSSKKGPVIRNIRVAPKGRTYHNDGKVRYITDSSGNIQRLNPKRAATLDSWASVQA